MSEQYEVKAREIVEHIAWCRYIYDRTGSIRSIVTCDSDAKGAFKVYGAAALSTAYDSGLEDAAKECEQDDQGCGCAALIRSMNCAAKENKVDAR